MAGLLDSCNKRDRRVFPGEQQALEDGDPVQMAQLARNVRFGPGDLVATRHGTVEVFTPGSTASPGPGTIDHMVNWIAGIYSVLIYLKNKTSLISRSLTVVPDLEVLLQGSLAGVDSFVGADQGSQFYWTNIATDGSAVGSGYVWDTRVTGITPNVESLFQRAALASEITLSSGTNTLDPGESYPTAGVHNIAIVITTANGYETGISPIDPASGLIVPLILTASGANGYTITITPTGVWPAWCKSAAILMTTKDNLARYFFVQGVTTPIASGFAAPITMRVNRSDADLASSANSRDADYLQTLIQSGPGGGPALSIRWLAASDDRMAYGATYTDSFGVPRSVVYVSDPNKAQVMNANDNAVYPAGGALNVTGRWVGSALFMFSENSTSFRRDNGDKPALWPPIEKVDDQIGTRFVHGVATNPTRSRAWVAHQSGLYLLTSRYADQPISYVQGAEDWKSINWGAATGALKVVDWADEHLVIVAAPLNGAPVPTHLLVWNYIKGLAWNQVRYSKWNISTAGGGYFNIGGVAVVLDPDTGKPELYMGRAQTAGKVMRCVRGPIDTVPGGIYSDDVGDGTGAGIDAKYIAPSDLTPEPRDVQAISFQARGDNDVYPIIRMMSGSEGTDVPLRALAITLNPNTLYTRYAPDDTRSAAIAIGLTNGAQPGAYFILSMIREWSTQFVPTGPIS